MENVFWCISLVLEHCRASLSQQVVAGSKPELSRQVYTFTVLCRRAHTECLTVAESLPRNLASLVLGVSVAVLSC